MLLLEETLANRDGAGPVIQISSERGKLLILTLGITRMVERDSVLISIWGSPDGRDWGLTPLVSFTPKYYCGFYSAVLNLASRPEVGHLRVLWHVQRWKGAQEDDSECGFYVSVEASGSRLGAVA